MTAQHEQQELGRIALADEEVARLELARVHDRQQIGEGLGSE